MDAATFRQSLSQATPPDVSLALQALWYDQKGDWDQAHTLAQQADNVDGDWVHAYLHRKEGDEGNAGYWYAKSGKKKSTLSLEEEWEEIVQVLLG
jgi:hypothetical protein